MNWNYIKGQFRSLLITGVLDLLGGGVINHMLALYGLWYRLHTYSCISPPWATSPLSGEAALVDRIKELDEVIDPKPDLGTGRIHRFWCRWLVTKKTWENQKIHRKTKGKCWCSPLLLVCTSLFSSTELMVYSIWNRIWKVYGLPSGRLTVRYWQWP